jgi:Asp-tRNA(Asn)/Glu-tRNA(Gln) amidotransferase C subunit
VFAASHRSSSAVSSEQLTHLCRLANVSAPEREADRVQLQRDLGLMLTFVQQMQDDAPRVEPLASVSVAVPQRSVSSTTSADGAASGDDRPLPREELLAGAAETRDGFFVFKS